MQSLTSRSWRNSIVRSGALSLAAGLLLVLAGLFFGTGTADAQTAPRQPAACFATRVGDDVRVTWTAANNDNATSYRIRRQREGNDTYFQLTDTSASARAFLDAGLRDGTYRYLVVARNGNQGSLARLCGPDGGVTIGNPPAPTPGPLTRPLACFGTLQPNGDVFVTWTPAPGDNATDYLIRRSRNGDFAYRVGVANAPRRSFNNTGIREGTYQYFVEARNAGGASTATRCGPTGGVTIGNPALALRAPSSCTLTRIPGTNNVRVNWTPSANDGATTYVVRRARNAGQFFRVGTPVAAPTTTLLDSNIRTGLYTYTVESQNGNNRSSLVRCTPSGGIRI